MWFTCKSMNNLWQCYGWSVLNFFHCHNLPKDQTTTGHTWDQTLAAQWTDQSIEKDWYKAPMLHTIALFFLSQTKPIKIGKLTNKQRASLCIHLFHKMFVAGHKKWKESKRGQWERFESWRLFLPRMWPDIHGFWAFWVMAAIALCSLWVTLLTIFYKQ